MKKKIFLWNEKLKKIDLTNYTHIRVYHACRTTNIDSYISEGIHTFSRKQAYKIVYGILSQCNIEENDILRCFNKRWREDIHHYNLVCVNISKEVLLNEAGHYLIYGSEFICSIAADLFCQNKLKKIGMPTLIECYVAKEKFAADDIKLIEDNKMLDGSWDGGIFLRGEISADEIVNYTHPQKIYDPLLSYYYYNKY